MGRAMNCPSVPFAFISSNCCCSRWQTVPVTAIVTQQNVRRSISGIEIISVPGQHRASSPGSRFLHCNPGPHIYSGTGAPGEPVEQKSPSSALKQIHYIILITLWRLNELCRGGLTQVCEAHSTAIARCRRGEQFTNQGIIVTVAMFVHVGAGMLCQICLCKDTHRRV